MGNGASISGETINREQAQALAGESWLEIEPKFEKAKSAEGIVTAAQAKEFLEGLKQSESGKNLSNGDSMWKFLKAAASAYSFVKIREDLSNPKVKRLMKLIAGMPCLYEQNLDRKIESAAMTAIEIEKRHTARRNRVRKDAEKQLAEFDKLSKEDRELAINDGNLEHYSPENQIIRESIFDDDIKVNQLLDKWWNAAEHYIDRDSNGSLTSDEYAIFYKRLIHLVFLSEGGEEQMTDEEINDAMKNDFKSDSGNDGSVSKEEFRYSVFQLADQWTNSCEVEEYVDFLKKGFEVVFSDLIKADKIQIPTSWSLYTKGVKTITPMALNRCIDLITRIIYDKIDTVKSKTSESDSSSPELSNDKNNIQFSDYVIIWFQKEYGFQASKKRFKSFISRVLGILDDDEHPVYDYVVLFAQLCSFKSSNSLTMTSNKGGGKEGEGGKIVPLSSTASNFIFSMLNEVLDVMPRGEGKDDDDDDDDSGGGGGGSSGHKIGIDAKTKILIHGNIESKKSISFLKKILLKDIKMEESHPLYRISMLALEALTIDAPSSSTSSTKRRSVMCMKFTVLLGIIFTSWDQEHEDNITSCNQDMASHSIDKEKLNNLVAADATR